MRLLAFAFVLTDFGWEVFQGVISAMNGVKLP